MCLLTCWIMCTFLKFKKFWIRLYATFLKTIFKILPLILHVIDGCLKLWYGIYNLAKTLSLYFTSQKPGGCGNSRPKHSPISLLLESVFLLLPTPISIEFFSVQATVGQCPELHRTVLGVIQQHKAAEDKGHPSHRETALGGGSALGPFISFNCPLFPLNSHAEFS